MVESGRFSLSVEKAHLMLGFFRWKYLSTWISKISVQLHAVWSILSSDPRDRTCSHIRFRDELAQRGKTTPCLRVSCGEMHTRRI